MDKIREENKTGFMEKQNALIRAAVFDGNCNYDVNHTTTANVLGISHNRLTACRVDRLQMNESGQPNAHGLTMKVRGNRRLPAAVENEFVLWLEEQIHPSGRSTGITAYFDERFDSIQGTATGQSITDAFNQHLAAHPILHNRRVYSYVCGNTVRELISVHFPHTSIRPHADGYCGQCAFLKNLVKNCSSRMSRATIANTSNGKYAKIVLKCERDRIKEELKEHRKLAQGERQKYKDSVKRCGQFGGAIHTMYRISKGFLKIKRSFQIVIRRRSFRVNVLRDEHPGWEHRARYQLVIGRNWKIELTMAEFHRRLKRLAEATHLLYTCAKFKRYRLLLSTDFAQSKSMPYFGASPRPAELYFKPHLSKTVQSIVGHWYPLDDKRSYQLFVATEVEGNKTSDYVISSLEISLLETLPMGLRSVDLLRVYMDNTTSTNKNCHVTSYGLHLVDSGRFEKVELCFLPTGHTKFYPDVNFAHLSNVYRRVDVFSEETFMYLCRRVAGFVFGMSQKTLFWWRNVLSQRFTSIAGVTQYRCLEFCKDDDGVPSTRAMATTIGDSYTAVNGGSLGDGEFDVVENLVSFQDPDAAMASLKVLKDAKYRDLLDVYDRFVPGGSLPENRPPCLRYPSAADAAMEMLHVGRSEAETIVNQRDSRRQTRAYYKVGEACKRWSPAVVCQMVRDSGMDGAADKLGDIDGETFVTLDKQSLMDVPFMFSAEVAENLLWLQLILKSL